MMPSLNTRHACDACAAPATIETEFRALFCDSCAASRTQFEIPSGVPMSDGCASPANPAPGPAGEAINSISPGDVTGSLPSGESEPLVTLASDPGEYSSCGRVEGHSVERDPIGATSGGSSVGRGRAYPLSNDRPHRSAGIKPGPQDSIPNPMPLSPGLPASANCAPVPAISAGAPFSSALDFEAEVTALEAEWLARGIVMNAKTFFIAAASDIAEQSKSVSVRA